MLRTAISRSFHNLSCKVLTPSARFAGLPSKALSTRSLLQQTHFQIPKKSLLSSNVHQRFMTTAVKPAAASTTAAATKVTKPAVAYWLYFNAGMVFAIVVVGGLTRLTESGLSITEWNVISGMKPPRSELEWNEEFEKYKQFPEYKM